MRAVERASAEMSAPAPGGIATTNEVPPAIRVGDLLFYQDGGLTPVQPPDGEPFGVAASVPDARDGVVTVDVATGGGDSKDAGPRSDIRRIRPSFL